MINLFKSISLLFFLLLYLSKAWAQDLEFPMTYYSVKDGLSNNYVTAILKDQEGFIWIATRNGLNRYDGLKFEEVKLFHQGQEHSVIYHFAQDNQGWFWIVSNNGLIKFHPRNKKIIPISLKDTWNKISAEKIRLTIDIKAHKSYAWFAGQNYLYKIDLKTLQYKAFAMPFKASRTLFGVFEDRKGRVWVKISTALYQFNEKTGQFKYYYGIDDVNHDSFMVESIPYEDSAGKLWLGTWFDYPRVYNPKSDSFEPTSKEKRITTLWLEDIAENGKKFMWAGGGDTGLGVFWLDDNRVMPIYSDACRPLTYRGNTITYFFKDTESETVWIGTDVGIAKYDPYSIRFHRSDFQRIIKKPIQGSISKVIQDKQKSDILWISVWADGVYRWNRKTNEIKHFNNETAGLPDVGIFDILQAKNGLIWTANGGGLSRYNENKNEWKYYRDFFKRKGVISNALTLHQDQNERIWFGCNFEGLWYFEPNQETPIRWQLPDIEPNERHYITKIIEDKEQNLWISSHSGLYKINFKNKTSQKIPLGKYETQKIALNSVFISANQHIWVSGFDFIYELDNKGKLIQEIDRSKGLKGQPYYIVEDEFNFLWIGTNNGLQTFSPGTKKFRDFWLEEGVLENEVSNQMVKIPSGEIIIGFHQEINYFKPRYFKYNTRLPKIVFKDIEINNELRTIDFQKTLTLYPGENSLKISFVALNFTHAQRNKYAYKLEGFHQKWIPNEDGDANFTNLEAGDYTFRVIAANNDGIWNQKGIQLKIKVIPPFYRQWWFRVLLIVIIFGLIFWLFQYRQQQRQKIEAIRNRIAKDLHDDMGSTLSSIRIISEVLQSQLPDNQSNTAAMLQRISQGAASLSDSMQDIIWSIKTDNDTLEDMLSRMRSFALKLLESKQIQFKSNITENFDHTFLSIEQRRNIYLIFKEAVNNAVKYAQCTEIQFIIQVIDKHFTMIIVDNGQGFDDTQISYGNGLQNMQKRAQELKGNCNIQSELGRGTRVEVKIKL